MIISKPSSFGSATTSPHSSHARRKGKEADLILLDWGIRLFDKEHLGDCINCRYIECLNLYKKSEDSEDAGNELYVYSILGKKIENKLDLTAHTCVNGKFLNASCFLTVPIFRDHRESYLSDILIQVTRDFKASIFLAFAGHYRQAMQVLRCAFENIISGVYFHSQLVSLTRKKASAQDFARLERRFNQWKKEGRVNVRKSVEILERIGFLSTDEERDWDELYGVLSKFVHTPEEFVTHVKHAGEIKLKGDFVCPACTYFNEEQLIEWSDCFQRVFANLLKTLTEFHPEAFDTESGKLAVSICRGLLSQEFADKMKVSDKIQKILATLQNSG